MVSGETFLIPVEGIQNIETTLDLEDCPGEVYSIERGSCVAISSDAISSVDTLMRILRYQDGTLLLPK